MTGLPNRHLLSERLQTALATDNADQHQLALRLLDLDRFKEVNDTLGHNVGDVLLMEVAHKLRVALPETATVARLGGDEFALFLPGADEHAAVDVARATLATVARCLLSSSPPGMRIQSASPPDATTTLSTIG